MSVLPNLVFFPIKIPANYFVDSNKQVLKFTYRDKRTRSTDSIMNTRLEH